MFPVDDGQYNERILSGGRDSNELKIAPGAQVLTRLELKKRKTYCLYSNKFLHITVFLNLSF